jgi:hypothetical protein
MFPELKRHLDMTTLRHWSKKIANAKNIFKKSVKIISIRLFIYLNLSYTNKNAQF